MKDPRDTFIEKGYTLPLVLAIMFLLIIGLWTKNNAQTPKEFTRLGVKAGIQHPEIVTKQAILETKWFECNYCSLDRNNIFGFWNGEKYLEFPHWMRSIYYYRSWVIRKGYDGGDYYEFLKSEWKAPNMDKYCNKLKSIKSWSC